MKYTRVGTRRTDLSRDADAQKKILNVVSGTTDDDVVKIDGKKFKVTRLRKERSAA